MLLMMQMLMRIMKIQTLSKLGNRVTLSNGGGSFTDAIDDADADATNELQDLSLIGGELRLSGSSATIPVSDISPWTISSGNALKSSGKVGVGRDNPTARLEIDSDAGEDGLRVRINGSTKLRVRSN